MANSDFGWIEWHLTTRVLSAAMGTDRPPAQSLLNLKRVSHEPMLNDLPTRRAEVLPCLFDAAVFVGNEEPKA